MKLPGLKSKVSFGLPGFAGLPTLRSGRHSSPGLKAWGFLAGFINSNYPIFKPPPHSCPLPHETVSSCHSEALAEACPEQSEGTHEILHFVQDDTSCQILHGVYPEPKSETLPRPRPTKRNRDGRFTQGDTWRRVQNDKHAISLIVTQPPRGEG